MNVTTNKPLASILMTALPLLIAVGCAGNSQKLSQADLGPTSGAEQIYSLDASTRQHTLPVLQDAVAMALSSTEGYVVQVDDMPLVERSVGDPTAENILETTVDVITEAYESEVLPPPRKMVFHFEPGKNELKLSDHEIIKTHAEYLLQHPRYVLVVTGHTDNQGSKSFNQRLSELRAQNVATLLMDEGIGASQLRVSGLGDAVPMMSPKSRDENRRVEFVYQDSMMATK